MSVARVNAWWDAFALRRAGVVYAFVLLVGTFTIMNMATGRRFYLDGRNVANVLEQTSLVGILAVFMTVVLVSGNFDLSVAATAAITGAAAVGTLDHVGIAGAVLIAIACGAAVGVVNGLLVQVVGVNSFIVTLGMLTMLRGLFLALTDGRSIRASNTALIQDFRGFVLTRWQLHHAVLLFGIGGVVLGTIRALRNRSGDRLNGHVSALIAGGAVLGIASIFLRDTIELTAAAWYFLILAVVVWLVMSQTIIGRRVYAVGGNAEAARLAGISVNRYRIGAFILNGAAAGFVGAMFAARTGSVTPIALLNVELTVIAACILGGVSLFGGSGNVLKSVVGALILFTLANGFNIMNIGANWQKLIEGAIIIASAAIYTVGGRRKSGRAGRGSYVTIEDAAGPPDVEAAHATGSGDSAGAPPDARARAQVSDAN